MEPVHRPVLLDEVIDALAPGAGQPLLIDATVGEGGHTARFLQQFSQIRVVGLDADEEMLGRARDRLAGFGERVTLMHHWFDEFFEHYSLDAPDRVLVDLGISMYHFTSAGRGFSFGSDDPLDMRLNATARDSSAEQLVNELNQEELADLIYQYGEERYSRRIADRICRERLGERISTSAQLASIVSAAVPKQYRYGRIHPATRTFQAIRIAVNQELARLERLIPSVLSILPVGGRLGIISFHSLEDRIVKHRFREIGQAGPFSVITRKPVVASDREKGENPASRSAKLRVIERVEAKPDGAAA